VVYGVDVVAEWLDSSSDGHVYMLYVPLGLAFVRQADRATVLGV